MRFLGKDNFFTDKDSFIYQSAYNKDDITSLSLSTGYFDFLYATKDTSTDYCVDYWHLPEWDNLTLFSTDFKDNSCDISSLSIDLNKFDKIKIKRRKKDVNSQWQTICTREVNTVSDFYFSFKDYLVANNTEYQYNLIPVSGSSECYMNNIIDVTTDYYGVYFTDGITQYGTQYDIESKYSRNKSSSTVTPINSFYPITVENGKLNYKKGDVTARFLLMSENEADLKNGYMYRENVTDFLIESPALMFKNYDGLIAIVSIGDEINTDSSEYYLAPKTSFSWTQIGDADNTDDLKKYGLIQEE